MNYKIGKINVMVVEGSSVVRQTLKEIIDTDPSLNLYAVVTDVVAAQQKFGDPRPDVLILDITLPKTDGLKFFNRLMSVNPLPVIISVNLDNVEDIVGLKALAGGAVDIINKPENNISQTLNSKRCSIINTIKRAARTRSGIRQRPAKTSRNLKVSPRFSADEILVKSDHQPLEKTETIVAIGTSTGGTQALESVLTALAKTCPAMVIVQHMPETFTEIFAQRLNMISQIEVLEAKNGDKLKQGRALIAPGGKHMVLMRQYREYYVKIIDGPLVNRHKPSVDVLFRSVANCAGKNAVGIIMTGMGDDGAHGLKEMHDFGAYTIGQNEASCMVYSMPREANVLGAVDVELPLEEIAATIMRYQERS